VSSAPTRQRRELEQLGDEVAELLERVVGPWRDGRECGPGGERGEVALAWVRWQVA